MGARKPTPVDVVFFPKKIRVERAQTETMPELSLPAEEIKSGTASRKKAKAAAPATRRETHEALTDMAALGHELFSRGKVNEARVVFEGLVISNPNDAFVHTMLGTIHLARNDLDAALVAFEKALALDPSDIAARVYRGEIRLNKRRFRAAADDFANALKGATEGDPFADRARRLLKLTRKPSR